jgi:hypothetical protein
MSTFKPTPSMVQAAQSIFETMAIEQTIRPIVEKIQQEVIDAIEPIYRQSKKVY